MRPARNAVFEADVRSRAARAHAASRARGAAFLLSCLSLVLFCRQEEQRDEITGYYFYVHYAGWISPHNIRMLYVKGTAYESARGSIFGFSSYMKYAKLGCYIVDPGPELVTFDPDTEVVDMGAMIDTVLSPDTTYGVTMQDVFDVYPDSETRPIRTGDLFRVYRASDWLPVFEIEVGRWNDSLLYMAWLR